MKNNKLSIVIPILNENKNLFNLTKKILRYTNKLNLEIIFVDDNSNDGSDLTLNKLSQKYKNVKYFIRTKKKDLTKSCFYGIKKSKNKIIMIMDGDGQHNPKYIEKMYKIFISKKIDFLVGVRNFNKIGKSLNYLRYMTSRLLIYIFKLSFTLKTSDPMSGFFIFKKNFFLRNKNNFYGRGYKILADFIYSTNENLEIVDYKIRFLSRKKEKSKMSLKILIILSFFIINRLFKKLML